MKDQGVGSWTLRRARMTPDKAALVQDGRVTSYAELHRRVSRMALGLRRRGIGRGDRVAFLGPNSVELVVAMFAAAKLAAVFLPVNTRLAPPELAHVLADSGARLLLYDVELADGATSPEVSALPLDLVRFGRDGGAGLEPLGLPAAEEAGDLDERVGLDDLFMIQYTSGTSGRPKGEIGRAHV